MFFEIISIKVILIIFEYMNVLFLEKKLRFSEVYIIVRVYDNKYVLDVRIIFDDEFDVIVEELRKVFN